MSHTERQTVVKTICLFSILCIITSENIAESYLETILFYMFPSSDAGDINNGYEHVTHPIGGSSIDGNNYDNIYNGDINGAYDKKIHQTGSKDGNKTGSGNNYDNVAIPTCSRPIPEYESLVDAILFNLPRCL